MPHRRGLGFQATDQRAESELGRMGLRGQLELFQANAGVAYNRTWLAYVTTLDGPHWPWRGQGRGVSCDGCPEPDRQNHCVCERRKQAWLEVVGTLGMADNRLVARVAVHNQACPPDELGRLRAALTVLAVRFGYVRLGLGLKTRVNWLTPQQTP